MRKRVGIVAVALAVVVAGVLVGVTRGKSSEVRFRKAKVDRGEVISTVTATGTLSAVTTVKVGSQVSGIIASLHVDFNSAVKRGQLLAELDPTPFRQAVEQRRADLEKAKVELRNTEISLVRAKRLFAQQLLAQSDLDTAQTNRDAAAAAVEQSAASHKQAETNLGYANIASPIDGVVVDRQYDIGQTVAASFQAPTLFTIAQDLTKMQVLTNIDEADVGRIRVGQTASFTVDAFPDGGFKGTVSQIRLSPQIVQNVVTYPVMLDVPNPDLKLKPGMTANVQVPVDDRKDVLRVPNAALRFKPEATDLVSEMRAAAKGETGSAEPGRNGASPSAGGRGQGGGPRPEGGGKPMGGGRGASTRAGVVYVEAPGTSGKLRPINVKTLITDGNLTAVESADLKEGAEIVVGLATARAGVPGGGGPPRRMF